jgi:molybdate transport system substrate-binding protein
MTAVLAIQAIGRAGASCCLLLILVGIASAAEVKLLSPQAIRPVLSELIPQFERSSGHKVTVDFGSAASLTQRLENGEVADAAILSTKQNEQLRKKGKIVADSNVMIAKVGFGLIVRSGAAKPDVGSVDALKRAILAAKSIGTGDPAKGSSSGRFFAVLVERLGIAEQTKPKIKLFESGTAALQATEKGEIEFAFEITSAAVRPGIELGGALPAEVQNYNSYVGGVVAAGKQVGVAATLLAFLASPTGRAIVQAKGFEVP